MAIVGASNDEQQGLYWHYAKGGLLWNLQTPVSDWTGVPYSTISIIYEGKSLPNFYFYLFLIQLYNTIMHIQFLYISHSFFLILLLDITKINATLWVHYLRNFFKKKDQNILTHIFFVSYQEPNSQFYSMLREKKKKKNHLRLMHSTNHSYLIKQHQK